MLNLANKYRPKEFSDLTEQSSVKQILQYQIESGTVKNAYLFTGSAGTGKTTSARIFASMVNKGQGIPIELDAASNNGVDAIRDICEQAQTRSLDSEYKVLIIDECHMISASGWGAMLKTLEEPPAKSIFILCTTDPQKIPATILSRVQRYNFQRISLTGIIDRLKYVINEEQILQHENFEDAGMITYEPEAISYIARLAEGGMRDALSLLDKCLSYNRILSVKNVVVALGVANYEQMFYLNNILFEGKLSVKDMFVFIDDIFNKGLDLKQFMKTYFEFLLDILKYRLTEDFEMIKIPSIYSDELSHYGEAEFDMVKDILKLVLNINAEIKWQKDSKSYIQAKLALYQMGELFDL